MAKYKMKVPLIAQEKSKSCWRACVKMVKAYYSIVRPDYGWESVFIADVGIQAHQIPALAGWTGMHIINAANHEFTGASLIACLRDTGPLWAAGYFWGYPHVIVVTGASDRGDGKVYFNDPEYGGHRNKQSIAWFNENRLRGGLMCNIE